jgi:hypothetical protein
LDEWRGGRRALELGIEQCQGIDASMAQARLALQAQAQGLADESICTGDDDMHGLSLLRRLKNALILRSHIVRGKSLAAIRRITRIDFSGDQRLPRIHIHDKGT